MKKLLILIVILFNINSITAQMGLSKKKVKQAEIIKTLPLAVVLGDSYKSEKLNNYIKNTIETYWKFNSSIKFISEDEFKDLKDKSSEDYAYLYYTNHVILGKASYDSFVIGLFSEKTATHFNKVTDEIDSYVSSKKVTTEKSNKNDKSVYVTEADVIFSLLGLQKDLIFGKTRIAKKEEIKIVQSYLRDSLPSKTLLLDKSLVTKKLIKSIDKLYKNSYKIVDKEEIDSAILNKKANITYIKCNLSLQPPLKKEVDGTTGRKTNFKRGAYKGSNKIYKFSYITTLFCMQLADAKTGKIITSTNVNMKESKIDVKDFKNMTKVINY